MKINKKTTIIFTIGVIITLGLAIYEVGFNWIAFIITMLFAICMFIKMSAGNTEPRKKINALGASVITGAIFAYFSAGLVLYLFVSTLLDMLQTKLYNKYGKANA